jgi:hypothetical protein
MKRIPQIGNIPQSVFLHYKGKMTKYRDKNLSRYLNRDKSLKFTILLQLEIDKL